MSKYMLSKVFNVITYQFANVNGYAVEVLGMYK